MDVFDVEFVYWPDMRVDDTIPAFVLLCSSFTADGSLVSSWEEDCSTCSLQDTDVCVGLFRVDGA